jgi:hypothetical protein
MRPISSCTWLTLRSARSDCLRSVMSWRTAMYPVIAPAASRIGPMTVSTQ